jgi:hypothetical protein
MANNREQQSFIIEIKQYAAELMPWSKQVSEQLTILSEQVFKNDIEDEEE